MFPLANIRIFLICFNLSMGCFYSNSKVNNCRFGDVVVGLLEAQLLPFHRLKLDDFLDRFYRIRVIVPIRISRIIGIICPRMVKFEPNWENKRMTTKRRGMTETTEDEDVNHSIQKTIFEMGRFVRSF